MTMHLFRVIGRTLMAAAVFACLPLTARAAEPGRAAMVIGNGAYPAAGLPNPVNDARMVARALRELGFDVTLVENADRNALTLAVAGIKARFPAGGVGLVYYSGHALQVRGTNYLLPVDYEATGVADLPRRSLPLADVLAALDDAGVRYGVLILDACRDSPFEEGVKGAGAGLAMIEQAGGETLVAYATSAGRVAYDGGGVNSPFTGAFVSALQRPQEDIYDVFRRVRGSVREATGGLQIPWVSGSLESRLVLNSSPKAAAEPAAGPDLPVTPASIYYTTIAASDDPGDFQAFLRQNPGSALAPAARNRVAELETAALAPLPVPELNVRGSYPNVAGGLASKLTTCDLVAADPDDPGRLTPGIRIGSINTTLAIKECARGLGDNPAEPRLAFMLGRALDAADRYDEARALYGRAIEQGYSAAMVNLGFLYRRGRGVEPDQAKAASLYRQAADLGNLRGRTNTGQMYLNGWGVEKSEAEAALWMQLAADQGWSNAMDALAGMYRKGQGVAKDEAKAYDLFHRAASLGNGNAMNNVARMLRDGTGVERDVPASLDWFRRASDAGNAFAPHQLGLMYRDGRSVKADPAAARDLFLLAADRGYLPAYAEIGVMHEKAVGGRRDLREAFYYYRLTQALGLAEEKTFTDKLSSDGIARLAPALPAPIQAEIDRRVADMARRNG